MDIDYLHDVIEGKIVGRGVGKTTVMLIQALQSAEVMSYTEVSRFAVIFNNTLIADRARHHAMDIAEKLGIQIMDNSPGRCIVLGEYLSRIYFISRDSLEIYLRGIPLHNYFVDHYLQPGLSENERGFLESRICN